MYVFFKSSLDILEKLKNKKPKLDIDKAVNKELNRPGSGDQSKSTDKKSKTQLKKAVGKRKHKGGKALVVSKKGNHKMKPKGKGKKTSK